MTVAFLLLALAVLCAPSSGPVRAAGTPNRLLIPAAIVGVGAACLAAVGPVAGTVAAAVVCPCAYFALRRVVLADSGRRLPARDPSVPLVLDLCAAALRAGRPPSDALMAASPAAPAEVCAAFEQVAGLLRLGADPAQAWSALARDGPLAQIAVVAVRSAASGARLAMAFERLAGELRADLATTAAVRAQRAGVVAMGPLAACFLPSFVVLGIVPVVVGMARTVLGTVG